MAAPAQKPCFVGWVLVGMTLSPSLTCSRPASAQQAPSEVARLIVELNDKSPDVRWNAARALSDLGPRAKDATQDLVKAIQSDPDPDVRQQVVWALCAVGATDKNTVLTLVNALENDKELVRLTAATALGELGVTAANAAPALARAISERDGLVPEAAAGALKKIAEAIANKNEPNATARRQLERALVNLSAHKVYPIGGRRYHASPLEDIKGSIQRTVNHLEALERASFIDRVWSWLQTASFKDWKTWAVILPAGWLLILFVVFLVKPLWLLHWNEALKDLLPTIKELPLGIPVGYASLIGLMAYRRRVLDAWVKSHIEKARENFDELPTAKDRKVHVPSPVKVNGQLVAEFSAATLRAHVGRAGHQCRWLIVGEGGAGKTSLGCLMARWAMAPEQVPSRRPPSHAPGPHRGRTGRPRHPGRTPAVHRGDSRQAPGPHRLGRADFPGVTQVPPAAMAGPRHHRPLHGDEPGDAGPNPLRCRGFPRRCLGRHRTDGRLRNLPKHTVEPMRIEGKRLSVFIDAYLNERKKRDLFDDEEYFEACLQLSRMVGERDITVLLAKLYADQMVAAKESPAGDELPKTIPDLMLRYLNELNRNTGGEDNRTVQRDCKAIAWECLKASYRPGPAERTAVIEALKGDEEDERAVEARLDYLINRLRVIQVTGAAEDRIRFVLDPLAEYLAGLQVVEENQGGNKTEVGTIPARS